MSVFHPSNLALSREATPGKDFTASGPAVNAVLKELVIIQSRSWNSTHYLQAGHKVTSYFCRGVK